MGGCRWGINETFPAFCIQLLSSPDGADGINYSVDWKRFEKVFGRDSLRIVSFSNLIDNGVDLFQHFCEEIIGLRSVPEIPKGLIQRNTGLDIFDAEIIRSLNYLYYAETSRTRPLDARRV